ncbi:mechanosensitive ion channel family protein [Thiohalobacter sp. IOR34]|uniref:mechanosensitive ion channel family protein n=1 Tax=Thiohalobacter sp. IOR34 TaxID=3057176 RepID=UPI0025B0A991|nr:mechanosensitive ion channel family protein [Thiohalobacter sp. IOR34]WJW76754.1 mechanosensitive ion channel family protein [Thiohalobacter sp. IOR34]
MDPQSLLEPLKAWSGDNAWIVQVFIVVFGALLLNVVQKSLLRRIHRRLREVTENPWDDALVKALQRPLGLLIWILGLAFAADIVRQETEAPIFSAVGPLRDIGVIATFAWFLVRLIRNVQDNLIRIHEAQQAHYDRTTIDAISKVLRASVIITAALVALQTLGFSISGVLAFGGIGGIAVGFAAKDLLANFFGGLMVYLDRPFEVGDWIRSPDRDIEGTVEEIGWRLTRIRTFDKRPIYVPNSVFTSIAVENPQRMTHRRIYETIGIRYADIDVMDAITRDVRQMLLDHPAIDSSQTLMVNFNAFGPSSVDFFVYTFTKTTVWTEYHEIKHDVLLKIAAIIDRHGAEIAFPTRTLHLPDPIHVDEQPTFAGKPLPPMPFEE